MQIVHFICDRCHREAIEDDALDWKQTQDGRDMCPSCAFPFPKKPDVSFDAEIGITTNRPTGSAS